MAAILQSVHSKISNQSHFYTGHPILVGAKSAADGELSLYPTLPLREGRSGGSRFGDGSCAPHYIASGHFSYDPKKFVVQAC